MTSPMSSHHPSLGALPRTVRKTTRPVHISAFVANALGFVATSFSIVMWVPQARITWRNRNHPIRLAGVSETTQWLSMIGYLLWGVFGILIGSVWVAAPSVVSFPLSIATIVIVRRGRRMIPATVAVPIAPIMEPEPEPESAESASESVSDWTGSIPTFLLDASVMSSAAPSADPDESRASGSYTPTTPIPILA